MSDSLRPHGLQHARPPCPSPTPGVYSNSYPLSRWCHPAISSSVIPFSPYLQSLSALKREGQSLLSMHMEKALWAHGETGCLRPRKWAFARHEICWQHDLGFLASRTVRNKCPLFKLLSLWCFVIAAQANQDIYAQLHNTWEWDKTQKIEFNKLKAKESFYPSFFFFLFLPIFF